MGEYVKICIKEIDIKEEPGVFTNCVLGCIHYDVIRDVCEIPCCRPEFRTEAEERMYGRGK